MNIINLTPHTVNIYNDANEKYARMCVPASGTVARCAVERTPLAPFANFPVFKSKFGEVQDLPEPRENTIYVVSALVVSALNGARPDVYCPGEAVRDESGRIIGCIGLSQ